MLNQHECHAGIVRQMAEQLRECLQSAGGGSYANNQGGTGFGAFSAAGRTVATAETGLTAAAEVFPGGVVRRFGRGESGARGERATPPGRRLPVFFATRHHYLSRCERYGTRR